MKWLFVGIISLFFVVFQTVLLPSVSCSFYCFDLTIILIVYVSLHFSHYMIIAVIAVIGGTMDSLSGGPFFIYTFSYIWIFLMVQLARQLVFQTSILFVMVISLMAVSIQQGLILFSVIARHDTTGVGPLDVSTMLRQVVWGGAMVPLGVVLITALNRRWEGTIQRWIKIREQKRNQTHG
jgi:rod shape-determining protein MreD